MLTLDDLVIGSSEHLKAAMQRMTRNRCGILFVCDDDFHLVGILSDGDVRRTLLADSLLSSPVNNVMNTDPVVAHTVGEASELVRNLSIVAVPVVDSYGRIREAALENGTEFLVLRPGPGGPDIRLSVQTGVLAIRPARAGSKRIPRKNLAPVAGRPLLTWAIEVAKRVDKVSYVLVSTDDAQIAEVARGAGAETPWVRPPDLSEDATPTIDVLMHAVTWAVDNLKPRPEFALLLEPTAPLRTPEHLEQALDILVASDADCVMSVSELPHVLNPEELLIIDEGCVRPYLPYRTLDDRPPRGQQSPAFVQNGLVYAFRVSSLLRTRSLYGQKTLPLLTAWEDFLDIDAPADLQSATMRLHARHSFHGES